MQSVSARKVIAFVLLAVGFALLISALAGTPEKDTGQSRQKALDEYNSQSVSPAPTIQAKPEGSNSDKAVLRIPVFGKNWVQPILAGVGEGVLDSGSLGRFPESTCPGCRGNYSLTGHRVTHGEPFRYLTMVEPSDKVYVDSAGIRYVYTVTRRFVVDEHEVDVLDSTKRRVITLITCDSYTQHTTERFVVRGVLTSTKVL